MALRFWPALDHKCAFRAGFGKNSPNLALKGCKCSIQLAVSNYHSIKDEAVLSQVAGTGREHRERNLHVPDMQGDVRATPRNFPAKAVTRPD